MSKNLSVYAIYPSRSSLEIGLETLRKQGFRPEDISMLYPENLGNKDLVHEENTKAPEGAATGGAAGAVLGGVLGWLAGVGALAIPGIGPLLVAGPIVAALSGVGAGATMGGVVGGLVGLGVPEYEAKRYEGRVQHGGILISVHSDNPEWAKRASQILKETGAEQISSTAEGKADFDVSDRPSVRTIKTA
jgi:hypothetical protein